MRKTRVENPRFLEARGTTKPIPSLAARKKKKAVQKLSRRINRGLV